MIPQWNKFGAYLIRGLALLALLFLHGCDSASFSIGAEGYPSDVTPRFGQHRIINLFTACLEVWKETSMVQSSRNQNHESKPIFRVVSKYLTYYLILFISVVLYLHIPKTTPVMAWLSSGPSNAALIANLKNHGLITSERVAKAMLGVCPHHLSTSPPL